MKCALRVVLAVIIWLAGGCDAQTVSNRDQRGPVASDIVGPYDVRNLEPEEAWPEEALGPVGDGLKPCDGPDDCETGVCVGTQDGPRCAPKCDDGCPPEFSCTELADVGPDTLFVCLPEHVPFCRPCFEDVDCARFPGDQDVFCGQAGPQGSFCTRWCHGRNDCPDGFRCYQGYCAPSRECDCLEQAGNVGFATACSVANQHGVCDGERLCLAGGLTQCDAATPEAESCDGWDNDCDGHVDEDYVPVGCTMSNQQGTCSGKSGCADGQEFCGGIPPSAETCDGKDNNCDGQTDEEGASGCTIYYADSDGDGYGALPGFCRCQKPMGYVTNAWDCADLDSSSFPNAAEICDGLDNSCDGKVDETCDHDGDGYCWPPPLASGPQLPCKFAVPDCDDVQAAIYPNAYELCDGLDNDCDGTVDEGCDLDGDGFCNSMPTAYSDLDVCKSPTIDCNDLDADIHPGHVEVCNAVDDDCDGTEDEKCDVDQDGFCAGAPPPAIKGCTSLPELAKYQCLAEFYELACPEGFGDCADENPAVHPNAAEVCDGLDNNCDGKVDGPLDLDGDGFCAGNGPGGPPCPSCLNGSGDCDDLDPEVNPDAVDVPDQQGLDSDCDGVDGSHERCVFVSETGHDFWPGTALLPKGSLAGGVAEVGSDPFKDCVLVAAGAYKEAAPVQVSGDIYLWGGYDELNDWQRIPHSKSVLNGAATALLLKDSDSITLGGLEVRAAEASQAASSTGILAVLVANLVLVEVDVFAANGGTGQPAGSGSGGSGGHDGKDGDSGCKPYCPFNSSSCAPWALGGTGSEPDACGGKGQGFSILKPTGWDKEVYNLLGWNENGEPSCCYKQWGLGYGGASGESGSSGKDGTNGQDGTDGAPGPAGAGGNGIAKLVATGLVNQGGKNGSSGMHGCGGGGGGMGGSHDSFWECKEYGGGGGGGGGGGRGGKPGWGGGSGGSSVGVALYKSHAQILDCRIETAAGGAGGAGGEGGKGGPGGLGGTGGPGLADSADGGDGGNGGDGGPGGGGGGGSGGSSIAVAYTCGYSPSIFNVAYWIGQGGAGGKGGKDGTKIVQPQGNGKLGKQAYLACYPEA